MEVCHTGGEGDPLKRCKNRHGENVAGSVTENLGIGESTAPNHAKAANDFAFSSPLVPAFSVPQSRVPQYLVPCFFGPSVPSLQISNITGIIIGRRPVLFWISRFSSTRTRSVTMP